MYIITQIVIVLKALNTSIQHEAYCWAWPEINVVLCNSLNTLFVRWSSLFKIWLLFLLFAMSLLNYFVPRQ